MIKVSFGAMVRPVRQGKPFTDQTAIAEIQKSGKLPSNPDNIAHLSHPDGSFYIVTPPDLDQMPRGPEIFEWLKKAQDVEV